MIRLTPRRVAAIYDCLKKFHPFDKWKLPPSCEVEFRATKARGKSGDFTRDLGAPLDSHRIMVSNVHNRHFITLVQTVAHEMCHQSQDIAGTRTGTEHNADFMARAKVICDTFGWDSGQF